MNKDDDDDVDEIAHLGLYKLILNTRLLCVKNPTRNRLKHE